MNVPLRVLLIEDSDDDAALVVRTLRRGGYDLTYTRVESAEAMRDALARHPCDLVISDYSMPQFSGPAALQLLHEVGIDVPFIIVSGTIGEETAVAAMKAGAHDFLTTSCARQWSAASGGGPRRASRVCSMPRLRRSSP